MCVGVGGWVGGGVGGGNNWVVNIFGATNCKRRKRETTLRGGGGALGACLPPTNV